MFEMILVNHRPTHDDIRLGLTAGGRLILVIAPVDDDWARTYLTREEWEAVKAAGDKVFEEVESE